MTITKDRRDLIIGIGIIMAITMLALTFIVVHAEPPQAVKVIEAQEFYDRINERLGYQAYVTVTLKPLAEAPTSPDPFALPPQRPKIWTVYHVEVGTSQFGGPVKMGEGVNFDECFKNLVKNHPYMFPNP